MLVKELYELVKQGARPIVKFNEDTHNFIEESLDPDMIGEITYADQEYDDSYRFRLDLNNYEAHNKSVAQRDWRDSEGNATLTWFDTIYYPEDGIEYVYLPLEAEAPLDILEGDSLLVEYVNEKSDKSYVRWLEEKVNNYRDSCGEYYF